MNRSYQYRGRPAARMMYPTCPIIPCESEQPEPREAMCDSMVLAMSYVLKQEFADLYEPDNGFRQGTVFAALDKPFLAGGMSCG